MTWAIWDMDHLRLAIDAAGVALWSWNVETDCLTMDELGCRLWSVDHSAEVHFEDLSARIHPADRDRVRAAFAATRAIVGAFEIDFRILVGDEVRWISARGKGNDEGMVARLLYGIFMDVTGRKQAEEANELLAGEMSHRVKNLLAIASGLTTMTSRSSTTTADMATELTQRLSALGRAHDLVRPIPGKQGKATLLGDLLSVLLAPYDDVRAFTGRVKVAVPRMGVGERAATTLALVVHELATNSVKYGALSVATGLLSVSSASGDEDVTIVWTESGGPMIAAAERSNGFGNTLVERALSGSLRGSISYDWSDLGLIATVRVNKKRLSA